MVLEAPMAVRTARGQARVQHQRQAGVLAGGHVDDVTGLQLLQRDGGLGAPLCRPLPGQVVLTVLQLAAQPRVLLEVAEVAGHGGLVALKTLLVALHLAGDAHDRLVGLELREGRLQQLARTVPAELLDQVDRHVVRRPEARAQRVRACAGQTRQVLGARAALPQHHGVALDVDAAPPRTPRQLRVFAGRDVRVLLAVPLDELFQHHRAGGHVDAEGEGLRREHGLDQAAYEQFLDDLLEGRQHARVVGGDAALEALQPLVVAEDVQVLGRDGRRALLDEGAYPLARLVVVEPEPRVQALLDGGLAGGAAEDEGDGGQQPLGVEPFDDLGPARRPDPGALSAVALTVGVAHGAAAPTVLVRRPARLHAGHAREVGVDGLLVALALLEQVVHPPPGEHVLEQRHGPVLGDDHLGVTADRVEPVAELLGVRHGRRQRHERDRLGKVNDHLFPHGTPEPVGEVVHLVHDHVAEAQEGLRTGVQHVPQHLGGHHDHRGVGVDAVVAGEQAHLVRAVTAAQIGVLLVRQRLDGGRVEALLALLEGEVDGELADDRLARAGGRGDQDALPRLERLAGLDLEGVEAEVVHLAEGGERGGLLDSTLAGCRVPLGR